MSLRSAIKNFYLHRILKKSYHDIRVEHLKKIGMTIGEECCIFSDKLETAEPYLISLGRNVMVSSNVMFTTHDASAKYYLPGASDLFGRINIGDNCFIGMGSIILPGVTIAPNCIIGAGSVVTKSFLEPGSVIAGNPARKITSTEQLKIKNQDHILNTWYKTSADKKAYLLENEKNFIIK